MDWLMVARGMAQGMILGGLLGTAALLFAGHDMAWMPISVAMVGGFMLGLIEREISR